MRFGLQINSYTWPGGAAAIGPTFGRVARTADEAGFDSIWVMDHFWQIGGPDSELQPMLEGWTTLGFMAAHSTRARLGPPPGCTARSRNSPRDTSSSSPMP